ATTGGCDCREKRFRREARLLGSVVGYSAKGKDVLPKYSGLNILVKDHFYRKDHTNTPKQYGNSAVVFKKGINKRTTFSRDDSLSMYPFRESVVLNSMQFKPKKKKKEKFKCDSDYCEAQIWGKVGVGDVAYALIPEGKDVPSAFIAREIPVYRIKSGKKGTLGWEKGELLFDPKSKEGIGLVESEKKSIEISRFCIDCKPVVKRINDHAFFPKWDLASLKKRHAKEKNIDVKREIYGEIVQRKHESDKEKKDYIFSNYKDQSNDEISRAISLQAMATYPKDKRTKMNLLKVLGHIKDAERESSRYARWGTSKATAPEIIIALSMATEMDEFKEDKEVQKILMKAVKKFPKFKKYYDYFSNEKGLCEQ
ncbi:MAG: hypothetical protein HON90_13030, partial [Halobacteriovoraceae bacterium]|nr:hypothetical protein [Halobacteriovoraceae bacterium]